MSWDASDPSAPTMGSAGPVIPKVSRSYRLEGATDERYLDEIVMKHVALPLLPFGHRGCRPGPPAEALLACQAGWARPGGGPGEAILWGSLRVKRHVPTSGASSAWARYQSG